MTRKFATAAVAALVVAVAVLSTPAHAACDRKKVTFCNAAEAVNGTDNFSMFRSLCSQVGLNTDKWWNADSWESTIYVPTNQAMQKYLTAQSTTLTKWLANTKKTTLTRIVLQHIVSTYFLTNFRALYAGQQQASLLTMVNYRSRLTISLDGASAYVASEKSKAKMDKNFVRAGSHSRITLVPIDTVLLPDLDKPDAVKPIYNTTLDVINHLPGLEDFKAAAQKAFTINAKLKADLANKDKVFMLMAPNAEGIAPLVKLLGVSAQTIMDNVPLLESIVRYHLVPGVAWTAEELKAHRDLVTLVPGSNQKMSFYNGHTVVIGPETETRRNRGKFWNVYPRTLRNLMPGVDGGSWDLRVGKNMVHVIDSFLVPSL